jgi:UDP-N-acetyl-2-amino-2-deoxyglucuronate dehydrogenase|tara:strand:+ start:23 stop:901 length:879 start_codon:yes stop_codon:yes gene_type:complete
MVRFGLIGASGYIAPRHMEAIKNIDGELVTILDPNDSVGVIDRYHPKSTYFSEYERFDREVDRLKRMGKGLDYISIASPNYLHDAHIRFALKNGSHAICEKPLVLNPYSISSLEELQIETGKKIYPILQLRLHQSIIDLKEKVGKKNNNRVELKYVTPRGKWYHYSWKGDDVKSGGIATNIGIHFFDMLLWIFGDIKNSYVSHHTNYSTDGYLELERANIDWSLSIDERDLPHNDWKAFRSIKVNDEEIDFSDGFTDLHTKSYKKILNGNGFTLEDAKPALELVHKIRNYKT